MPQLLPVDFVNWFKGGVMLLPTDFFIQHPIDFEHKQYLVLAFLQDIERDYSRQKIYPGLGAIIQHIKTMTAYREQQKNIHERMKTVNGFNWEKMQFDYQQPEDPEEINEINRIVDDSLQKLRGYFKWGRKLFDDVSAGLNWRIIGVIPPYQEEGYIILHRRPALFSSYQYRIGKVVINDENYFGIHLELKDETQSRFMTYSDLKLQLIQSNPDLPVPMTIAVETDSLPLEETLLPVVKAQALLKLKRKP